MSLYQGCPGAIRFREAVPEYVDCPRCGEETEIWSDEVVARCHHCQALVRRDRGPSCIDVEVYERLRYPPPSEGKRPNEKSEGKA